MPANQTEIVDKTFMGAFKLTEVVMPEKAETVGDYAFFDCRSLRSITLPKTLEDIGEYAFWNCTSLESVVIPSDVTEFGVNCFPKTTSVLCDHNPDAVQWFKENGYRVMSVSDFTYKVVSRGSDIFAYITGYTGSETDIYIPNSLDGYQVMGFYPYAFREKDFTDVQIGEGIPVLGVRIFEKCRQLT